MKHFIVLTLIVLLSSSVLAEAGRCQDLPDRSVYKVEWRRDLPLLGASGGLLTAALLWHPNGSSPNLEKTCPLPAGCDPNNLNGLDRRFAGKSFKPVPHKISNGLEIAAWVGPFLLDRLEVSRHELGTREFLKDTVVQGETLLLNFALTETTKRIVWRPRPFAYRMAGEQLAQDDTYKSFYSGHTSSAFAMSIASAMTYAKRHPGSKKLAYGLAIGIGGAVGVLRVAAHKHFPTDVLVGAVSGSTIGWFVPAFH